MATTTTNIKINIVEPGSSTPVDPTANTTTTTDILLQTQACSLMV